MDKELINTLYFEFLIYRGYSYFLGEDENLEKETNIHFSLN